MTGCDIEVANDTLAAFNNDLDSTMAFLISINIGGQSTDYGQPHKFPENETSLSTSPEPLRSGKNETQETKSNFESPM